LDASVLAIVRASFVNNPGGGAVETVVTPRTQRRLRLTVFFRRLDRAGMSIPLLIPETM
jgi:hypothetical protein